jgi:hypothetical protein
VDKTGNTSGQNQILALSDSSSLSFGGWALLTGLLVESVSYHTSQKTYKVSSGHLVDDATTRSTLRVVAGAQPVWFVTNRWHLALDLQTTYKSQKTSSGDFDQTLITPILRYSLDRSALGLPHLYTSLTRGHYDWKAKRASDGSLTDTLWTTQTGFECLF